MHIPDGFLSAPVWASLDVAAVPCILYFTRKAQQDFDDRRIPLLGVMGAFVFAAQMINFPVGAGTSGHLVGSALLTTTLGPAPAVVVMTAILAVQALIFQDGGLLALGANTMNMAVAGVLAAYLPLRLWSGGTGRRAALLLSGILSLMTGALLAILELRLSGVPMPGAALGISLGLFAISAVLEGAITLAVVEAIERLNPKFILRPAEGKRVAAFLGSAALVLALVGVMFASAAPDGLERLAENLGIASSAQALVATPLADYEAGFLDSPWGRKAAAGIVGLAVIYVTCLLIGRMVARRRSA